jgi:beta-lactamase regulating signal transducer with metallopeptidase domain
MSNLFSNLLAMSIAGSAVSGVMLLLRPVTAKILSAKWQYGIGKMAIAFFSHLFPFLPESFIWFSLSWKAILLNRLSSRKHYQYYQQKVL